MGLRAPGLPEACNSGAADASAEVIAFVDADVEVHEDALDRLARLSQPTCGRSRCSATTTTRPIPPRSRGFATCSPSRPQQLARAGRDLLGRAGGDPPRRSFAAGGFDAARYPEPASRTSSLDALIADGAEIALDPEIRGTHRSTGR